MKVLRTLLLGGATLSVIALIGGLISTTVPEKAEAQVSATAINPGMVLIQLGVEGVTVSGGVDYANCLVKTDTNGLLDESVMPDLNPVALYRLSNVYWIDGTDGQDLPDNGAVESAYKTLEYAMNDCGGTNPVFVFTPGTYTTDFTITDTRFNDMTFMSYGPGAVELTGTLQYNFTEDVVLNLYRVKMQTARQYRYGYAITVNLYDQSGLTYMTSPHTNTVRTVQIDPTATQVPSDLYTVVTNLYDGMYVDFTATNVNRQVWAAGRLTIAEALNELSYGHILPTGVTMGAMSRWNGTNWVEITAGADDEVLFGGDAPNWQHPTNTFLTNYYTIAQIEDIRTNYYTIPEVDDILTNYYTIVQVDGIISNYYTTNQIDNILTNYYDISEVDNLFTAYYTTNQVDDLLTNKFDVVGGTIEGDTDVQGILTVSNDVVVTVVDVPALPVSEGKLGQVAFDTVDSTNNYFYWYHPDGGGPGTSRWVRVLGDPDW